MKSISRDLARIHYVNVLQQSFAIAVGSLREHDDRRVLCVLDNRIEALTLHRHHHKCTMSASPTAHRFHSWVVIRTSSTDRSEFEIVSLSAAKSESRWATPDGGPLASTH